MIALLLPASAHAARDSTVPVPGGSNLWLAGGNPAPGDGPGSAPPSIKVPDGATSFTIVKVTGMVSCCEGDTTPNIPPDGGGAPTSIIPSVGSIGPYSGPSNLPLLGLFLEGMPTGDQPGDQPKDNTNDFRKLSPKPKQPFFIGDGRKGAGGAGQTFGVPKGATRLFLGIPDSYGFNGPPQKYEDNKGSFKAVIRWKIPSENATLSGHVLDSFGDGVGNVKIIAKPAKGKTQEFVTAKSGFFELTFAKPANDGALHLTAKPLGDDKIVPKTNNVTLKPGKTTFAKFEAEVGILKGKVFELLCPTPYAPDKCRERVERTGAVVSLNGSGIRKEKFNETDGDGYRFRVPPGNYKLRVFRLDVSTTAGKHGADVCKEDKRIPVQRGENPEKPVECKKTVEVKKLEKKKRETVNFVAVPRRVMVPTMRFLTFERGKRKPDAVNTITAGLVDPVEDTLFGTVGDKGDDYPTIQCRTGCALIEIKVRDLFGEPVKNFKVDPLVGTDIAPNHSVTPGNSRGRACMIGKKAGAGKAPGFCFMEAEAQGDDGTALGVYAAPGVVDPAAIQDPPGVGSARVGARITANRKDPIAVIESIRVKHNQAPGIKGTVALRSGDADALNYFTDPSFARGARDFLLKLPPSACEKFEQWMADKLFGSVKSFKLSGKKVKIAVLNELCELLGVPNEVSSRLLDEFDDKLLTLTILDAAGVKPLGFLEVFGVGVKLEPGIPTSAPGPKDAFKLVPRVTTAANRFIADWARAWRSANGQFQIGNRFSIRIYEVTHYAFSANTMSPQPAAYISLFSPVTPTPTNLLITDDYDPFSWLN